MAEPIYAATFLLHGDRVFEPGDLLTPHYRPEDLTKLREWGHASTERPDVEAVYCLVDHLTHHPHMFGRGDRIDHVIPRAQVRVLVERGHASYTDPRATPQKPSKA
jgi:hypothetical protein